jgi:DNA polymerase III subunit gamma/tau
MSVLYRKYRSKSLDELVGQDHIVKALKSSIANGKVAHAYLLTGPRGTGKTSVARIIAHAVNDIEYDEDATNLDVIEIDAASNRRIDEIRDLRDKVHIAPTSLKYKVYIIDEVHMLTKEAFNALLKTLEEPPAHVIFVLATTELQKVPDTIISRTQRYAFKPITVENIIKHLAWIADQEKIAYEPAGLEAIAEHAEGGFRDAIGLLDQVRHTTDIVSADAVMSALGTPPDSLLLVMWDQLKNHSADAPHTLHQLYLSGYHALQIAKRLLKLAIQDGRVDIARLLLSVGSMGDAKVELQLLILENTTGNSVQTKEEPKTIEVQPKPSTPSKPDTSFHTANHAPIPTDTKTPTISPEPVKQDQPPSSSENLDNDVWQQILEHIKEGGHSVYGPLRLAEATLTEKVLKLGLSFPFHIKRVNEQKNLTALEDAIVAVTGKKLDIVVEKTDRTADKPTDEPVPTPKKTTTEHAPSLGDEEEPDPNIELMTDPLSIVKNVFGGAEVL